jgi:hypothetical protein
VLPHLAVLWWKLVVRRTHLRQIAERRKNEKFKMQNAK